MYISPLLNISKKVPHFCDPEFFIIGVGSTILKIGTVIAHKKYILELKDLLKSCFFCVNCKIKLGMMNNIILVLLSHILQFKFKVSNNYYRLIPIQPKLM